MFWMWAAAFLGMATKYAEIVLGLVFRQKGADGSYYGGPMYYIEKGLHARLLGVAAAVLLFFQNAGGTLIQSNTISDVAFQVFGVPKAVTGILMAAVMVFIIGGGLKRLADVASENLCRSWHRCILWEVSWWCSLIWIPSFPCSEAFCRTPVP